MKIKILLGVILLSLLVLFFVDPVPQWPAYHQFSDQRSYFGVPNFFNVVSSLLYLVIGIYGFVTIQRIAPAGQTSILLAPCLFYAGLILIAFASAFYHWSPNNGSLFWDRLAMTIAFMSLLSYVVSVFIEEDLGRRLLLPLLLVGIFSVIYWRYTEGLGEGDLRLYGLVQFLPMLLIPLILLMFGRGRQEQKYLWYTIGIYALAKLAELYDEQLMNTLTVISGHTLKHLLSAFAGLVLLQAFKCGEYRDI